MPPPGRALLLLATTCVAGAAHAASAAPPGELDERRARAEAFLAGPSERDDESAPPLALDAPPPPPRRRGLLVEASAGVLGQLGSLRNVTPTSPMVRLGLGWEPSRFLMLLAQADAAFGSTEYAPGPPDPRSFTLLGASLALRLGVQPGRAVGLLLQGEVGGATVTGDVLETYGYLDAHEIGPYFGGLAGVEWYGPSPRLALFAHGGVRSYGQLLGSARDDGAPLAWLSTLGLKHTF